MPAKNLGGRPKTANPASAILKIRITPALKASLQARARAASLSTAQYVLARIQEPLGVTTQQIPLAVAKAAKRLAENHAFRSVASSSPQEYT